MAVTGTARLRCELSIEQIGYAGHVGGVKADHGPKGCGDLRSDEARR